jgi:hypothetical protein
MILPLGLFFCHVGKLVFKQAFLCRSMVKVASHFQQRPTAAGEYSGTLLANLTLKAKECQ